MKYISVSDKLYEITRISFFYMTVEALQTNLTMNDVPESEVWDVEEFRDYKVKLVNNGGQADIVDFDDWKKERNLKE